jgi:nucleotide sugar dehydrogenase
MRPILEESGLKADEDFFLAHSPERVDPGNKRWKTKNTTKVVGGVGPRSLEVATAFYGQIIEKVVPVSSARAAELVKVFENTFRAVNIALVNELALLCDRTGLNVWEVLDAAFTKPFGIMPFYPGPGVDGHCIPLDPHYLEWKAREYGFRTRFIGLAGEINRSMPKRSGKMSGPNLEVGGRDQSQHALFCAREGLAFAQPDGQSPFPRPDLGVGDRLQEQHQRLAGIACGRSFTLVCSRWRTRGISRSIHSASYAG